MGPSDLVSRVFRALPPAVRTELLHLRGDYVPWEAGFDPTPPPPGPGEVAGPPDFVGVGVQKAGTSWWYDLLCDHPRVAHRADLHKERHALTRYLDAPFGPAEIAAYHGWFPRRPGTVAGEWTPDYLPYPWVAPLLARAAPEAKVLVLLRDPVDRFLSGLTFRLRQGAPWDDGTVADAVRQGFYAHHLAHWFRHVPPERVLVQQYEACRADPAGQLATTVAFLGLEPFEPADLRREVNVSGGDKLPLDGEARDRLVELYRPDVDALVDLVPGLDLSLWRHLGAAR